MLIQPFRARGRSRSRAGFTVIELLVALALIIFIMAILSVAFVEGLDTFRRLKGIGDMQEDLRGAATRLRDDVFDANRRAASVIAIGLATGKADPGDVADLKGRYEAIRADAAILEPRLRRVLRGTTNPVARRVMLLTLQSLAGVRESACRALEVLDLIAPD
jgi:hypothetical protein